MSKQLEEFKKRYTSKAANFHLWSQTEIAELWWKEALIWVLTTFRHNLATKDDDELVDVSKMIEKELEKELQE